MQCVYVSLYNNTLHLHTVTYQLYLTENIKNKEGFVDVEKLVASYALSRISTGAAYLNNSLAIPQKIKHCLVEGGHIHKN